MLKRAAAAGAAVLVLAGSAWLRRDSFGTGNPQDTSYGEEGRALAYGIPADLNHLPLASLSAAMFFERGELPGSRRCRAAAVWAVLILTASLGGLLAGGRGAAAAALLMAVLASEWAGFGHPQTGFSVLILTAACLMVWKSRGPGAAKTLLLALGLGACLLYRSAMAFFPLVLAAADSLRAAYGGSRADRRRCWLQAACLGFGPYVLLVPWMWAQSMAGNGLVPFERGQARSNFVVGSLGIPFCLEGDWQSLLPSPGPGGEPRAAVWGWGFSEMARHPVRTARAVARRVGHVIGLHPWLFVLAASGFWLARGRPGARDLGLLAAYLVGVHCIMAVKDDYFVPLWPVLAALAACLAASSWKGGTQPPVRGSGAAWAAPALLALAGAVIAVLYADAALALRAVRSGALDADEAAEAALAAHPDDPWLWARKGESRLAAGDTAAAREAFSRATALRPGEPRWTLRRGWLDALAGDGKGLAGLDFAQRDAGLDTRLDEQIFKAHAGLRAGNRGEMRRRLSLALMVQDRDFTRATMPSKPAPEGLLAGMRGQAPQVLNRLRADLGSVPAAERLTLTETLSGLRPDHCGYLLEAAALAVESGERRRASAALKKAGPLCVGPGEKRRLALVCQGLGEPAAALSLAEEAANLDPRRAGAWVGFAETAAWAGKAARARDALARAGSLDPTEDDSRRIASVHRMLGEPGRALDLTAALVRRGSRSPGLWVEHAAAAASLGRRELALEALARAGALHPSEEERRMMAATYRSLGRHDRAMELFEALARSRPGSAGPWMDLAAAAAAAGSRPSARDALARAEGLGPSRAERHRAALVHQALGEHGLCVRVLERLVAESPAEAGLWSDLGVCSALAGAKDSGRRHFAKAVGLDPAFLPAVWSLGSLSAGEGRAAEALRLYDRALALPTPPAWAELRARIEAGRAELRGRAKAGRTP